MVTDEQHQKLTELGFLRTDIAGDYRKNSTDGSACLWVWAPRTAVSGPEQRSLWRDRQLYTAESAEPSPRVVQKFDCPVAAAVWLIVEEGNGS